MTRGSPHGSLPPQWRFLLAVAIPLILISFSAIHIVFASAEAWGAWHHVRKGDTIWGIAKRYQVSTQSILRANRIPSARRLYVGKKLFIPGVAPSQQIDGAWYQIKGGDTLWALARKHRVSVRELMRVNNLKSAKRLQVNQKILIPNPDATGFTAPLRTRLSITSGYGYRRHPVSKQRKFHHGVDIRAKPGYRVYASKSGKVVRAGWYGGYGNVVVIKHKGDYTTWYGHLTTIRVKVGEKVRRGRVVGLSGSSGNATGPHLHFEIRWKGKSIDPARYIPMP